jgi:heme exporter protein A
MTESISLRAVGLKKAFNRRVIFDKISFELSNHESLSITGRNGSGKSTLVKILSGLLSPSSGSVSLSVGGFSLHTEQWREYVGFVAPYLQLYDEFTGSENLRFAMNIRGHECPRPQIGDLLDRVGLASFENERVGTYSSGMKQRLRYAFALLHEPRFLILDEPMSNLDEEGIAFVRAIIERQMERGILIVATNDADEARLCQRNVDLDRASVAQVAVFP